MDKNRFVTDEMYLQLSSTDSDGDDNQAVPKITKPICSLCPRKSSNLIINCKKCSKKAHNDCISKVTEWTCDTCINCNKCNETVEDGEGLTCDQCNRVYHVSCAVFLGNDWRCHCSPDAATSEDTSAATREAIRAANAATSENTSAGTSAANAIISEDTAATSEDTSAGTSAAIRAAELAERPFIGYEEYTTLQVNLI